MRVGYQVSVDIVTHRANMESREAARPVLVLTEVLEDDAQGWQRNVHEVRFLGRAVTQYGWGEERAHRRGTRFDASVWVFTDGPIEYRDDAGWQRAE